MCSAAPDFLITRSLLQGNPYIYGSFNARNSDALVIGPYQLQSTPTPTWYMSNVLIGVVGQLDTDTLQVHRHAERPGLSKIQLGLPILN